MTPTAENQVMHDGKLRPADKMYIIQVKYDDTNWIDFLNNHYSLNEKEARDIMKFLQEVADKDGELRVVHRTDVVLE